MNNISVIRETPGALLQGTKTYRAHDLFMEAINTADFPQLLRDGVRAVLFDSFAYVPTTYQDLVDRIDSVRDEEVWLELAHPGIMQIVPEGDPFPQVTISQIGPKRIRNFKRGYIIPITREMLLFDRTNQIRQIASDLGNVVAHTREQAFYDVITTTGNYTKTSADNDVGNNTNTTTFSANGIELAYATLTTMKDRRSGRYLGIMPDTLIVGPRLAFAAKRLFQSPEMIYSTGETTATRYGAGTMNPFFGMIKNIVVSPFVGTTYQWCLMQAKRAVKWQVVQDMNLFIEDVRGMESESVFVYDTIRYRVDDFWGMGMFDDRFAYFSDSTTAPTIA